MRSQITPVFDLSRNPTNEPPRFAERLFVIVLMLASLAIGFEQGAKHTSNAYVQAARIEQITERERIQAMADIQPCTTDSDCAEKFPELAD